MSHNLCPAQKRFGTQIEQDSPTLHLEKAENADQFDLSIPLRPFARHFCSLKDGLHLRAFPSLRQPSSPADTHDEDHRESAWRSPDTPPESDVVAFAVVLAGRLLALESLVPGSHAVSPDSNGFSTLLELL
jgi:hypothetical protein